MPLQISHIAIAVTLASALFTFPHIAVADPSENKSTNASVSSPLDEDKILARAMQMASQGDHAGALPLWEQLAAKGDEDSMIDVALIYHQGLGGIPVDYGRAIDWYLKAQNGDALNNMGVMYREGLGLPKNRKISYLLFLTVHMTGMGGEQTITRANSNLRTEIAELTEGEKQEALCYTVEYFKEYVNSRGKMTGIPKRLRASSTRKRIKELGWWMPGEIGSFECPEGT